MKRTLKVCKFFTGILAFSATVLWLGACSPPIEKLWEFPVGSPLYSTPLVVGDLIVFGSESGTLHAVDKSGQTRWQFQAPSAEIFSHPLSDGKMIFFGATNQMFYAIDMRGQLRWQFAARERIKSDPALAEGVIYATSYDGHVYALKSDNGKRIWQFPTEKKAEPPPAESEEKAAKDGEKASEEATEVKEQVPEIKPGEFSYAAPAVKDGILYVGNLDGYMYAIQTSDGTLKWRFNAGEGITSTALVEGGVVYFGSKNDNVYAIDAGSGKKLIWKFTTGDDVLSSPKAENGVLYIGSNDNNFYALDQKTGKEKCHFSAKGPIVSYAAFYKNLVFFAGGQGDGNIYAISEGTCKMFFTSKTGYKIESDPVLDGDRLYVTSGDRKLHAFKINKTK
ncbi:MAG TPA: PQQ-binding-like beta-propeller repeat protein [Myxococcota bacterium]|nr:PQQ-binding-like beta-propeller repeat protein [Myxococcota bacterium]